VVKRDIGQVSECCPKVKEDMTNLDREVSKLKEEIKRMKGTQDPLVEAVGQLKGQLARVDAGQQSAVVHLQEEIAAGESKVKDDLSNVQGELAKLKEEIKRMKITTKQFPPSVKKGEGRFDVPDGIIAHYSRMTKGSAQ
jgi:chromosome segregation ATPase